MTSRKPHKLRTTKSHTSYSDLPNTWAIIESNIFYGHAHTNPTSTVCQINDKDDWPHLLFLCNNKSLEGLRSARHNDVAHQLTNLLKSSIYIRQLTLIIVGNQHGNHQDNTILPCILSCTCNTTQSECLAKLRLDIVYIQSVAYERSLVPTLDLTIQIIEPSSRMIGYLTSHTNKRRQMHLVCRRNKSMHKTRILDPS